MAGIDLVGAASFSGADQLLDMGAPKFEGRGALGKVLGPGVIGATVRPTSNEGLMRPDVRPRFWISGG
jgi:hypothetical protein